MITLLRGAAILKRSSVGHRSKSTHAALPYAELPAFMQRLRATDGMPARAVEFMILTGVRLSEARNAAWDEIDDNVWTIPAERMKGNKEHRVPLPPPVCDLLESLPRVGGIVFGGASRNALLAAVKAINPDVTAHGFRSTFRTWIAERTSYPEAVAEQALAHAVSGAVLKAYRRTDLFDRRRRLMAEWARYCYSPVVASGQVVALHG